MWLHLHSCCAPSFFHASLISCCWRSSVWLRVGKRCSKALVRRPQARRRQRPSRNCRCPGVFKRRLSSDRGAPTHSHETRSSRYSSLSTHHIDRKLSGVLHGTSIERLQRLLSRAYNLSTPYLTPRTVGRGEERGREKERARHLQLAHISTRLLRPASSDPSRISEAQSAPLSARP